MAKLIRNDQSFRYQPVILELKDTIVMSGKVYDKSTLALIPFTTLNINGWISYGYPMQGKTDWVYEAGDGCWDGAGSAQMHGGQVGMSGFAVDNNDSSIGYVLCCRDDGLYMRQHKISLETHDILITGATARGSSTDSYLAYQDYPGWGYIVAQDDDYLYVFHKYRNQKNSERYVNRYTGDPRLCWISKSTMALIGEYMPYRMQNMTYLGQKGDMLFFAQAGVYYNSTYVDSRNALGIYKFNMATKTGALVTGGWSSIGETFATFGWATRPWQSSTDVLFGYWTNRSDDVNEGYRIYRYELDMNLETATISGCSYDFTTLASGTTRGDVLSRHNSNNRNHKVVDFVFDDGSNKYVSFLITEMPGQEVQTLDCFKIHTFLIGDVDYGHLTYKSTVTPGFRMRGMMPLEDDHTKFMLFGDSHSEVYTWNSSNEEFDYTSTVNMSCRGATVDQLNRLWMEDNAKNIHLISNNVSLTVTISPEYSSYNFEGTTISSYVEVDAWDIDDNRMDADVLLTLEGSTYFTDDTQSKQVTTTSGSPFQVDIKITGTSFSRMFGSVVV
jgi:hypothetical protein